jgi:formate hydrogenlyase subunit 6/NADH:ubiquinone oxidoreductase subunit I
MDPANSLRLNSKDLKRKTTHITSKHSLKTTFESAFFCQICKEACPVQGLQGKPTQKAPNCAKEDIPDDGTQQSKCYESQRNAGYQSKNPFDQKLAYMAKDAY